jgi:hypothetical protein
MIVVSRRVYGVSGSRFPFARFLIHYRITECKQDRGFQRHKPDFRAAQLSETLLYIALRTFRAACAALETVAVFAVGFAQ